MPRGSRSSSTVSKRRIAKKKSKAVLQKKDDALLARRPGGVCCRCRSTLVEGLLLYLGQFAAASGSAGRNYNNFGSSLGYSTARVGDDSSSQPRTPVSKKFDSNWMWPITDRLCGMGRLRAKMSGCACGRHEV